MLLKPVSVSGYFAVICLNDVNVVNTSLIIILILETFRNPVNETDPNVCNLIAYFLNLSGNFIHCFIPVISLYSTFSLFGVGERN